MGLENAKELVGGNEEHEKGGSGSAKGKRRSIID